MELPRHAYLHSLAASPAALAGAAVRVKLVFTEELAAFVHRQRGFSACWFLIPRSARLVGDLLHEIAQEFELLERCPQGIELLLDGFHVLANQEVGMVRDNDTLVVHCVAFVGEKDASPPSRKRVASKRHREEEDTEGAEVRVTKRKTSKSDKDTRKKEKSEKAKRIDTANASKQSGTKSGATEPAPAKRHVEKKVQQLRVKPAVTAVMLGSSSSSESSSSSDSSDEDDDEVVKPTPAKTTKEAFRKVVKETVKSMKQDISVLSSSTAESSSDTDSSDSDSSDSDGTDSDEEAAPASKPTAIGAKSTDSNGKQDAKSETRTRRRRRPRRRPKNGVAGEKETPVSKVPGKRQQKPNGKPAVATLLPTTPALDTQPKEIRPLRIRGIPPPAKNRGMNHVRFDGPPQPTPDLDKYGPQSTNVRQKNGSTKAPIQTEKVPEDAALSAEPAAKKPFKEMWKRPYEIISSIHDAQEPTDTTKGAPTLDTLLDAFPAKPTDGSTSVTPSGLQTDDIVAYKTLTLCMETFQPVVSDWQCGQVVDVIDDDRTVTIIPYTWIKPSKYGSGNNSLAWKPSQPDAGEDACVSVNQDDISELRYLHGPTRAHLASKSS